jgi:hypothetical protein
MSTFIIDNEKIINNKFPVLIMNSLSILSVTGPNPIHDPYQQCIYGTVVSMVTSSEKVRGKNRIGYHGHWYSG